MTMTMQMGVCAPVVVREPWTIEAAAITKTFANGGTDSLVLRGINLRVRRGELVMLVGPSGSGKTTLLSILGCVLRATSGSVKLFSEEVAHMSEARLSAIRARRLGFVFQGHNLIASLSARENVAFGLQLRGVGVASSLRQADDMLRRVGLGDRLSAPPSQLSGGQRQRVAIARALAGDPPLVLADEPTAALDASSGLAATTLLRDLCLEHSSTALVVTHDPRILHLADRIIRIEDGLIQESNEVTS